MSRISNVVHTSQEKLANSQKKHMDSYQVQQPYILKFQNTWFDEKEQIKHTNKQR